MLIYEPMNDARRSAVRPEHELLLCCARTRPDAEAAAKIRSLVRGGIDWEYLCREARNHGLLPLVYWHVEASDEQAVPAAVLLALRESFHANARRNLALVQELLEIVKDFDAHGITAVPFKGPLLAASAYGNLALRRFSDLDILVRERDVPAARKLLASRGYRQQASLTPAQERAYLRSQCEHRFLREDGSVVELHWRLAPRYFSFSCHGEDLWRRLTRASLGGVSIPAFPAEDLLLILCVHGAKHSWERLEWICGVAEVIRASTNLDWTLASANASRSGGERMLLLGVFLAHQLVGALVPSEILERAEADASLISLAREVTQRLLGDGKPLRPFERHRFHLRARERWTDQVRYLLRLTLTPGPLDWALVRLPASLHLLYYGVRIARLIGKRVVRRNAETSSVPASPR